MKWLGFSLIVLASSAWGVQMGEGYALRRKALEDVFSVLTGLQGRDRQHTCAAPGDLSAAGTARGRTLAIGFYFL